MKPIAPLAGLAVAAALLGGCAVYPDGTAMNGNGYGGGYNDYGSYDGYATGVPVVPQTSVYMGYGNYSGPGYYDGPGRYYGPGPGPGYRGYPGYPDRGRPNNGNYGNSGNRGDNGGWHGQPNGAGPRGGRRLKAPWVVREDRAGRMRHAPAQAVRRRLHPSRQVTEVMAAGAATAAMPRLEVLTAASPACRTTDPATRRAGVGAIQPHALPAQPIWLRCAA